jgi:hypothetical protein
MMNVIKAHQMNHINHSSDKCRLASHEHIGSPPQAALRQAGQNISLEAWIFVQEQQISGKKMYICGRKIRV